MGAAAVNPYQHLGEEWEEESAGSWAQPQGCEGAGSGGLDSTHRAGLGLPGDQAVPACCRSPVGRCRSAGPQLHAAAGG